MTDHPNNRPAGTAGDAPRADGAPHADGSPGAGADPYGARSGQGSAQGGPNAADGAGDPYGSGFGGYDQRGGFGGAAGGYGGGPGSRLFDDLARFVADAAGATQGVRREMETAMRAQAEQVLGRLDVVRRDEFEAMSEVARRARAEAEALRARVEALEARFGAPPTDDGHKN